MRHRIVKQAFWTEFKTLKTWTAWFQVLWVGHSGCQYIFIEQRTKPIKEEFEKCQVTFPMQVEINKPINKSLKMKMSFIHIFKSKILHLPSFWNRGLKASQKWPIHPGSTVSHRKAFLAIKLHSWDCTLFLFSPLGKYYLHIFCMSTKWTTLCKLNFPYIFTSCTHLLFNHTSNLILHSHLFYGIVNRRSY